MLIFSTSLVAEKINMVKWRPATFPNGFGLPFSRFLPVSSRTFQRPAPHTSSDTLPVFRPGGNITSFANLEGIMAGTGTEDRDRAAALSVPAHSDQPFRLIPISGSD
jgi:hypothetical protein